MVGGIYLRIAVVYTLYSLFRNHSRTMKVRVLKSFRIYLCIFNAKHLAIHFLSLAFYQIDYICDD